jgi:hypothetical protein
MCFSLFSRIVHLKLSSLGEWPSLRVVGGMIFVPFFHLFLLILEAKSTLPRLLLTDTRHPAAFFVVFRPCHRKIRSCRSSEIGTWYPRAWGLSVVWCACGPRASFFWPFLVAIGHTASDLRLGGTDVSACPSRAAVRHLGPFPPLPAACFGWFLLKCRVFFSLFSWVTVCLCLVQILWEYLLANC